ncbi:MAG: hypothetical protein J0M24_23610 [Verrucomicrobia bacterium]|nr:hypothetical protein [Verrucomicrobiota bacterium]
MNPPDPIPSGDELERRLERLSLRPVPADWKSGVLGAARRQAGRTQAKPSTGWSRIWDRWLAGFPVATAGVAAIWLVAGLAGTADRWLNGSVASTTPRISAEQMAEARAQRIILWQLAGYSERVDDPAPPRPEHPQPSPVLRPRSDRRERSAPRYV